MRSGPKCRLYLPEDRDGKTILERIRNGSDTFGRPDQNYDKIDRNQDLPRFILANQHRFVYILNREGTVCRIRDWQLNS